MKMQHAGMAFVCGTSMLAAALLFADGPPAANSGDVPNFTATLANVSGAPDSIRFQILRWSTDEERDRLMAAWNLKPGAAEKAGAGKGAAKGGRGGGKGAPPAAAEVVTPESSLNKALQEATTVGYLWSSEIAGYALRFAERVANPDGSQRIILMTERRLGAMNQLWNPTNAAGAKNDNEFSVIELRLNAKGEGEGKTSLTGKVSPDPAVKIVTLENYDALPVVFSKIRRTGKQ